MPFIIVFVALLLITLVFLIILSKLEKEKTEFFHIMAHRIRSPISIVRWYVELLSNSTAGTLNDKQKEYCTEISRANERLSETMDSLMILLQLQSNNLTIKVEKVKIRDLIAQIIQKLQFKIDRHKLHLNEVYPKEQETVVQTDSKLLNIVLQNLIENAIRYVPENGNIDIKVDFVNKELLIEIKYNGYGIPKRHKSKILADSANSKDMGFSLHLVKLILKKIKAQINFKSEKNEGTVFSLHIPA